MAKSTKIIAALGVVAGLGVAAMPLASYAADSDIRNVVDKINITVLESCEFVDETSHPAEGTEGDEGYVAAWNGSAFAGSALPGAIVDLSGSTADSTNDGVHDFTVRCNTNGGYTVSAKATGLNQTGGTHTIPFAVATTYNDGSAEGSSKNNISNGSWTAEITTSVTGAIAQSAYNELTAENQATKDYIYNNVTESDATIITKKSSTGDAGTGFTATYKAYTGTDTPTGTYTGTITYTIHPAAA